jgi:hypothetical protein
MLENSRIVQNQHLFPCYEGDFPPWGTSTKPFTNFVFRRFEGERFFPNSLTKLSRFPTVFG